MSLHSALNLSPVIVVSSGSTANVKRARMDQAQATHESNDLLSKSPATDTFELSGRRNKQVTPAVQAHEQHGHSRDQSLLSRIAKVLQG
jgi:hypothetical protein